MKLDFVLQEIQGQLRVVKMEKISNIICTIIFTILYEQLFNLKVHQINLKIIIIRKKSVNIWKHGMITQLLSYGILRTIQNTLTLAIIDIEFQKFDSEKIEFCRTTIFYIKSAGIRSFISRSTFCRHAVFQKS